MSLLFLRPVLKDYLWGGRKLVTHYNKVSDLEKVAESWELSCHKDGMSVIMNGKYKGKTLCQYIKDEGRKVLGTDCRKYDDFPVLIKLIDAKDNLSVQVHPDNEYALRTEGEYGKTEMWYILDCEDNSSILYGFKCSITKEEFRTHIENNTLLEVADCVKVHKGDVIFIESGTLHAIGKGIVIAEIQQNSNTTYRIYDYGRTGADGKPRQLHIEKALDVTDLCPVKAYCTKKAEVTEDYTKQLLSECVYFTVYSIEIRNSIDIFSDGRSFHSLLVVEGEGSICLGGKYRIKKGDSIFIPASSGKYLVSGNVKILLTYV